MALAWKAGWVNALAGSNPASSATSPAGTTSGLLLARRTRQDEQHVHRDRPRGERRGSPRGVLPSAAEGLGLPSELRGRLLDPPGGGDGVECPEQGRARRDGSPP